MRWRLDQKLVDSRHTTNPEAVGASPRQLSESGVHGSERPSGLDAPLLPAGVAANSVPAADVAAMFRHQVREVGRLVRGYSVIGGVVSKQQGQQSRYEPPQIRVLGSVYALTQSGPPAKQYGGSDGASYNQQSVSWTS